MAEGQEVTAKKTCQIRNPAELAKKLAELLAKLIDKPNPKPQLVHAVCWLSEELRATWAMSGTSDARPVDSRALSGRPEAKIFVLHEQNGASVKTDVAS